MVNTSLQWVRTMLTRCQHPITEIENLIRSLPNKTSSGHDEITNILLKKLASNISIPLSVVFNKSLKEGSFPNTMKLADVVPLYKSKEKYYTTNYRPISLHNQLQTNFLIVDNFKITRKNNLSCEQ